MSIISFQMEAQVITDDFSDGDFTNNPVWIGDSTHFIVNGSDELQLQDSGPNQSCLATPSPGPSLGNKEWRFWVRENFSPSANNYGRVYLVSDSQNLKDSLNGYYLQFGEAGNNDAVELFRQNGLSMFSVCRGKDGEIASPFQIGVKVTRDSLGEWSLLIDPQGGTDYTLENSGIDTVNTTTLFFGVLAVYTKTDDTKFYWTDFYAGPIYINHTLPEILASNVISPTKLDVQFNERLDSIQSGLTSNYFVNKGIGSPVKAFQDSATAGLIHLSFANQILVDTGYTIKVKNLKNENGDLMKPDSNLFWRFVPRSFDVVINEVMANPKPPQNLPPYEYIELYNRTKIPIPLDNWKICIGLKEHLIGPVTILPDSFVVLCSNTASLAFNPSLPIVGVAGFPSLNNSGAELTLKTDSGRVMSCVTYSDTWYEDPNKKNGGWSLEQIDPDNPCAGSENWRASVNTDGGTPGKRNSIKGPNPDHSFPEVLHVAVIAPDTLCVIFSKPLDSTSMINPALYTSMPPIQLKSIQAVGNDYQRIFLFLSFPLQAGITYALKINSGIKDCVGNPLLTSENIRFALPQLPEPQDLVVNEILSDPRSGGVKYVELYNRSLKVIDLKSLNLASGDSITGLISDIKEITSIGYLLFPGDYVVLSTDGTIVKNQYFSVNPNSFTDLPAMPKMDIGGGLVALSTSSGLIIDQVVYSSSWQFPLLSTTKGVSLERIDFEKPSQDPNNWHSAAETVGFGTPGYRNSEYVGKSSVSDVSLGYELFSPDEDGYHDVLPINYWFDDPGSIATVKIFDSRGRLVRNLERNILLGSSGSINWDGLGDHQEKVPIGRYIIYFQVFHGNGKQQSYKLVCTLASKL